MLKSQTLTGANWHESITCLLHSPSDQIPCT